MKGRLLFLDSSTSFVHRPSQLLFPLAFLMLLFPSSLVVVTSEPVTEPNTPLTFSESSYYSRKKPSAEYLADMKPTSVADLMENYNFEQANNPSTSQLPSASDETFITRQNGVHHHHQQTDIPLQLSDILPPDRRSYDKMEPPKRNGKPTIVFFHVTVMSLDSIDESSMTFAADIFFSQTWQDYRLRFPDNLTADYRLLPTSWLNSMWRPDSFFKNAKKVTFQDVTIPNHYIWLYKDKSILYMVNSSIDYFSVEVGERRCTGLLSLCVKREGRKIQFLGKEGAIK